MTKGKYKNWKDLDDKTVKRYTSLLKKLHTQGITLKEAKLMNDFDLAKALDSKAKTQEGNKKLLRQISFDQERRNNVRENTLKYYKDFGYKGIRMTQIKKELIKTIGSTFFDIAKDLQNEYKESERDSYKHAKSLLSIPKSSYDDLEEAEYDILTDYDY